MEPDAISGGLVSELSWTVQQTAGVWELLGYVGVNLHTLQMLTFLFKNIWIQLWNEHCFLSNW